MRQATTEPGVFLTDPLAALEGWAGDGIAIRRFEPGRYLVSGAELVRTALAGTTTPFEAKAATFGAVAGWVPGSDRSRPVNAALAQELDRAWQAVPAERITAELRRSAEAGEAWPGALSTSYLRLFGEQLFPGLPPRARQTLQDALAASDGLDRTSTALRRLRGRFAHSRADAALHRWAADRAGPLPEALRAALGSADDVALALHGLVGAVCRAAAMVFAWTVLLDRGWRPGSPAGAILRPAGTPQPAAHRVREALRLWPVAWLLSRKVTAATELGGVSLVPGDRLYLCTYLLHRDPDVWAEPGEYRPGRWAGPPEGHKARYLPYGFGSAACVGSRFVNQATAKVLECAGALDRFDLRIIEPEPVFGSLLSPPVVRPVPPS
ncbi:cytochrome P450 [Amycolatopsis sp. MtRt-6]|uniref:cytochrome P450 n=1 Tax=Amycolatopsis sp. MtRt-6 TaxID=2792782 RepID=UPI001A8DF352|nr:cytochrome P450 [Amycolatopsis sp. MtRt-6]